MIKRLNNGNKIIKIIGKKLMLKLKLKIMDKQKDKV